MADTGFIFPTSTGFTTNYGGSNEYTNPSNAYADDASYATRVDTDGSLHYQSYGGFTVSIPEGATIEGIEVVTNGKGSAASVRDGLLVYNPTANSEYSNEAFWNTTETDHTFGGPTELFSFSWTPDDFNDETFYVIHNTGSSSTGRTTSLDSIKVKIYYSESSSNFFAWFN